MTKLIKIGWNHIGNINLAKKNDTSGQKMVHLL